MNAPIRFPDSHAPAESVQLSTQRGLSRALKLRVPVEVDRVDLVDPLRGSRCLCCKGPHVQTKQKLTLRPGADRWPLAEAALVLLFVAAFFGPVLAGWSMEDRAFELWQWAGWILVTLTSGAAVAVGMVRLLFTAISRPVEVRVATCARCAIQERTTQGRAMWVEVGYFSIALVTLFVSLVGYGFGPVCETMVNCEPPDLGAGFMLINQLFLLFWVALFGRIVFLMRRARREPAVRKVRNGRVTLAVPPSWLEAFDRVPSAHIP